MTTDAPPIAPTEEDILIEAMLADAEPAAEPGTVQTKDVLHRGDAEVPAPVVVRAVQSAGYAIIYNTRTGEPNNCNRNMLRAMLKEHFTDGKRERVFTVHDPGFRPFKGNVKCRLHPEDPRREEWDRLGLPVCDADGLANLHQQGLHMRRRHKTSWETIERLRVQAERDEDRTFQRELLGRGAGPTQEPASVASYDLSAPFQGHAETHPSMSHVDITPPADGRPKFACRIGACKWEPKASIKPGQHKRALASHQRIMHLEG